MSHPHGLIKTDPEALAIWRLMVKRHSLISILVVALITMRALMPWRIDNLGEMVRTPRWKISLGQLGGLADGQIDFLERFAEINARRVEHVFRATALLLVSIPVGAAVAINELIPGFWQEESDFFFTLGVILILYAIFAGLMMGAAWRARDLHDVVRFEQARRALERSRAASGGEAGA